MSNFNLGYNANESSEADTISFGTEKYSPQAGGGIVNTFLGYIGLGTDEDKTKDEVNYKSLWDFTGVTSFPEFMDKIKESTDILVKKDGNGNTILHVISNIPGVATDMVEQVLSFDIAKQFINTQNKKGDTPAHLAAKSGNSDVIDKLKDVGADLNIKNGDGEFVASESEEKPTAPMEKTDANPQTEGENTEKKVDRVNQLFGKNAPKTTGSNEFALNLAPLNNSTAAPPATASVAGGSNVNTEAFLNSLVQSYNPRSANSNSFRGNINGGSSNTISLNIDPLSATATETNTFFNKMVGGDLISLNIDPLSASATCNNIVNNFGGSMNENTDELISNMVDSFLSAEQNAQDGGSYARGQRKLNLYSDYGKKRSSRSRSRSKSKGSKKSKSKSRSSSRGFKFGRVARELSALGRQINNQVNEIHKRVIQKIIELMKVDEETARTYKSGLWKAVKDKHGDKWCELSQLDRATELEKFTIKKNISKIDLEAAKKIRDENRRMSEERREKNKKEKKSKPAKAKKQKKVASPTTSTAETPNLSESSFNYISPTSEASVPNMSYSDTSFSDF